MSDLPNIVLVHDAWADGSSWSSVIEGLQSKGYDVTAPKFPESSLADDVARLGQVLGRQDGPTLLAGHSRWEAMPELPLFEENTAAFVHEMPGGSLSDITDAEDHVGIQVLTPIGVLNCAKQLSVVRELTDIAAAACEQLDAARDS